MPYPIGSLDLWEIGYPIEKNALKRQILSESGLSHAGVIPLCGINLVGYQRGLTKLILTEAAERL